MWVCFWQWRAFSSHHQMHLRKFPQSCTSQRELQWVLQVQRMMPRMGPANRGETWRHRSESSGIHLSGQSREGLGHWAPPSGTDSPRISCSPTGFSKRHLVRMMSGNDILPKLATKKKNSLKPSKIISQRHLCNTAVITDSEGTPIIRLARCFRNNRSKSSH